MGNCVSSKQAAVTAKVIGVDGTMEEYPSSIRAGQVMSRSPGCYLCCSEAMVIGSEAPGVPETEELKPGELYFLMPLSKSRHPLSLHDLCWLAVVASAALRWRSKGWQLEDCLCVANYSNAAKKNVKVGNFGM